MIGRPTERMAGTADSHSVKKVQASKLDRASGGVNKQHAQEQRGKGRDGAIPNTLQFIERARMHACAEAQRGPQSLGLELYRFSCE